ncbi:regulator of condensation [Ancylostoma duodenale]|uniref:Regulator of condensation n=1 Tax=Ancylostoma duodenale TaxID=51022 RepID=A0A0C2HBL3_9BILA|nr:regulator of condensation [Ancylostoma duodenale]
MRRELLGCGLSEDGQLGLGSRSAACVKLPEQIVGAPLNAVGTAVTSVACGEKHTILLAEDGKMWSVGGNEDGQLGRGGRGPGSFTIYPVSFSGGVRMLQVAAGRSHSLAVAEDGRLFAWGSNEHGQLAMPRHISWQETPKRVGELTEVVQVACGPLHCIALLESGAVAVWGEQADGAILHSPQIVTQLIGVPIVRVVAGGRHCVAISAGGGVYVWGHNEYGQLGTGDTLPRSTPHFLEGMSAMHIIEAYCGDSHTLLLSQEGRLFAFGSDVHGQIGGGKKFDKHTNPAAVTELMGSTVTRVACGRNHSVVVIGGRLYPFGQNANGQLGNGSALNQLIPRQTEELDHVVAVFAGFDQTFILRSIGTPALTAGPNCPLKVPLSLGKANVLELLSRHEKLDLIGLLESVFSSISCINGSFLYEDERRFLSEGRVFGVDLDDVMETFSALGESSDARQYADLARLLDIFRLSIIDTCQMSVFGDFDPSAMCSVESLRKWWVVLPVRHFNRLATAMLTAVRCLVKDKVNPSECRAFLDILASLCAINKVTNKIPLENFYVHELADNYNLKMDYVNWARAQTSMNGARLTLFGFDLFVEQPFFELTVRRQHIVQDTINGLLSIDRRYLQRPLRVQFMSEEAEDAGGVKKEFFMILFQKLLQSDYGMFVEDPDSHLVWFSGYDVEEVNYYKMVGILCGLAVYNCVLVAFPFPLALYKMLLDQQPVLEDLTELSPVEGRSLQELLDYQGDDFEDVFCLNFTISYAAFGSTETLDLKPGGADIAVTQSNKADYVQRYVHHRLCVGRNGEVGRQATAFRDGFKMVLNSRIVAFFQPRELMELVIGNENYDWSELRKNHNSFWI